MIYHMLPRARWDAQQCDEPYRAATLESEGFMHCTAEPTLLCQVADRHYRHLPGDWVILFLEPQHLQAELRWEPADGHLFPHLYGPLNLDAVVRVVPFPRDASGAFLLPPEMEQLIP